MTKKILHSSDGKGIEKDFLIPIKTESGFALVGTKSGKSYDQGIVVYTGKELTPAILGEKASGIGVDIRMDLYESYLTQIKSFKISKLVVLKSGPEFGLEYAQEHT